jgi:hypothetical protein
MWVRPSDHTRLVRPFSRGKIASDRRKRANENHRGFERAGRQFSNSSVVNAENALHQLSLDAKSSNV